MAVTQPIFKLEPPDFAWQQIQIISTDDDNDDNNNINNNNDDNDDNNNNNNKNHKSFEASSVIPRFNRKIKQIQNLTVTMTSMMMMIMIMMMKSFKDKLFLKTYIVNK